MNRLIPEALVPFRAAGMQGVLLSVLGFAVILTVADVLVAHLASWAVGPGESVATLVFWIGMAVTLAGSALYGYLLQKGIEADKDLAREVEAEAPGLEQRLVTAVDFREYRDGQYSGALVQRLHVDAFEKLQSVAAGVRVVSVTRGLQVGAAASVLVLLAAAVAVDDFSARTLQIAYPRQPAESTPPPQVAIHIDVQPGDHSVEAGEDVAFLAELSAKGPGDVSLFVSDDGQSWRAYPMMLETSGMAFSYYMQAVGNSFTYYVRTGDVRSETYRIAVTDSPELTTVFVRYDYPAYTKLPDREDTTDGFLEAPEGTMVDLEFEFSKPLVAGRLELTPLAEGQAEEAHELDVAGTRGAIRLELEESADYRVRVVDEEQISGITERFAINVVTDMAPEIRLIEPGGDKRVMPLDEVTLKAEAMDDYEVVAYELHYGMVGDDERVVEFTGGPGPSDSVLGDELVYLEDLGALPGDFVSYYFRMADNNGHETLSDIYFLEVVPTEQEYRLANGGGGGGGGGGGSSALVKTQKDVISATWKLRNRQGTTPLAEVQQDAAAIVAAQREVLQRTMMSISRLSERQMFADEAYNKTVRFMQEGAQHMTDAVDQLEALELASALPLEQGALKAIMKAEALSRKRDLTTNRSRGGGGGADGREREELRELFEMEVGETDNRYESPNESRQERPSDVVNRLQELAKRQEQIVRNQRELARRAERMSEEERRRRLERLRRDQEELQGRTRELANEMRSRGRMERQGARSQGEARSLYRDLMRVAEQMQAASERLTREEVSEAMAESQKALERLRRSRNEANARSLTSMEQLVQELRDRADTLEEDEADVMSKIEAMWEVQNFSQDELREVVNWQNFEALLETKDAQRDTVKEIESLLQALAARKAESPDELDADVSAVRKLIDSSRIGERIKTSQLLIEQKMLNVSYEVEKDIAAAIGLLTEQVADIEEGLVPSREKRLARNLGLIRELRNELEAARAESVPSGARRAGSPNGISTARLSRSREIVEALIGGANRGEDWFRAVNLVRRNLDLVGRDGLVSISELEERVLNPLVKLENRLASLAELDEIGRRAALSMDEDIPSKYQQLVDEYYRELSRSSGGQRTR